MPGTPKLRIKKYFGSASIQEMDFNPGRSKRFLAYFFTKDGGSNILIAVDGKYVQSYDDLSKLPPRTATRIMLL